MLVKCPDCKKKVSRDSHICPKCGCDFDLKEDYEFEAVVLKSWSKMGFVSIGLTVVQWFIMFMTAFLVTVLINPLSDNNSFVAVIIVFVLGLFLVPVIQIVLGIKSLKKYNCYKWPGIVGIVLGSIPIVFWGVILIVILIGISQI